MIVVVVDVFVLFFPILAGTKGTKSLLEADMPILLSDISNLFRLCALENVSNDSNYLAR